MISLRKQQSRFGEGKKTNCDIITEAIHLNAAQQHHKPQTYSQGYLRGPKGSHSLVVCLMHCFHFHFTVYSLCCTSYQINPSLVK